MLLLLLRRRLLLLPWLPQTQKWVVAQELGQTLGAVQCWMKCSLEVAAVVERRRRRRRMRVEGEEGQNVVEGPPPHPPLQPQGRVLNSQALPPRLPFLHPQLLWEQQ